ncbi:rhodanese-like domain-containing protein [Tumebacillus flagellatus]|uniref:Sulfurtransferase n=1 Tax=Tumebacillus flagellatus TaxID=1157490 RepID=A0A074LGP0_9BACL|nr:rhodanese-like domain-containing protein [Tumebacillus flagellatus]KEO81401.1 sulfurtransferase [Tumebacillus flagellatus]
MQWWMYLLYALLLWFVISRLLPVRGLTNLTTAEVQERLKKPKDFVFVDVREVGEYRAGHIPGFQNIPLSQLRTRVGEIDSSKPVILTCQSGMRSKQAAKTLHKHGFRNLSHLKTGMSGWNGNVVK